MDQPAHCIIMRSCNSVAYAPNCERLGYLVVARQQCGCSSDKFSKIAYPMGLSHIVRYKRCVAAQTVVTSTVGQACLDRWGARIMVFACGVEGINRGGTGAVISWSAEVAMKQEGSLGHP